MQDEEPAPAPRKLSRSRKLALGAMILVMVVVGWIAVSRYLVHKRIADELESIRAAGLPATFAELEAWCPPIPAEENAAQLYEKACSLYARPNDETLPWNGYDELNAGSPVPPAMIEAMDALLAKNEKTLQLLHQAASLSKSRYTLDPAMGFFPHFHIDRPRLHPLSLRVSACSLLLAYEALRHVNRNAPDAAVESLVAGLRFSQSLESSPFSISHARRALCIHNLADALADILSRIELTESQKSLLSIHLESNQTDEGLYRALVGERGAMSHVYRSMQAGDNDYYFNSLFFALYRWMGWIDNDYLAFLRNSKSALEVYRESLPERLASIRRLDDKIKRETTYQGLMPWCSAWGYDFEFDARRLARLRSLRAALAVEHYRTTKGRLPDALADLVPGFVPALPQDPFVKAPLRYKRLDKGYAIYSVGPNGKDDGGRGEPVDGEPREPTDDVDFTVRR